MAENGNDVVINQATGLPVERTSKEIETAPVVNKITGLATKGKPQPKSYLGNVGGATYDLTKSMSIKDYNSFKQYGVDVRSGIDHVEARAQNQSTLEKVHRGLTKAGVTAVGALGENTVGLLWGIGSVATGGSFYDNAFGRSVDAMNEWAAEAMPNYYTRAEERADAFSLTNLTSANFWADKVANGVGYVVGSIATDVALAYVSGGTSLGLTAARYAAKFGKAAKVLSAAEKASAIKNVYTLSKAAQKGQKIGKTLTEGGKLSTKLMSKGGLKTAYARAENGLIAAIGESNVEARQAKNETIQALTDKWLSENEGKTIDDLPDDVAQKIEDAGSSAGNTVFSMNMPLVAGTNMVTIGRMMGPGYQKSVQRLAKQETKDSLFNIRKGIKKIDPDKPYIEAGLDRNWAGRTAYRVNKIAGEQFKSSLSEAAQEGGQVFASEFAQKYYKDKYADKPNSGGLIDAIEHGLRRTLGTKEGQESMLIGAIVGGGTTTVSNVGRRIRGKKTANQIRQANTDAALDLLNSGVLTKPLEGIQDADKASGLINYMDKQAAIAADTNASVVDRRRAHKQFKDAQYALYAQQANSLVNQGRMDLVMEQLEDAKDLTEDEFKKAFGYDVNQPLPEGGKSAIVDKLKDRLKKHKTTRDRIDQIVTVPQATTGLPRALMSEEAIEQEQQEIEAATFYRNSLYNRASQIDGHTERMESIYKQMESLDGWSGDTLSPSAMNEYQYDLAGKELFEDVDGVAMDSEEIPRVMSGDLINELNKVEQGIVNPLDRQEFNKLKQDYIHLAAERQAIINSYEALTGENGPVTAEFLQLKQQQIEEAAAEQQLQQETEAITNTAEVPDDFSDFPANATEAQKNEAKRKSEELGRQINDLASEQYAGKTLEELEQIDREALAKEENGRQKLAALDVAVKEATEDPENIFRGKVPTEGNPAEEEYQASLAELDEELRNADNAQEGSTREGFPEPGGEKPDDVDDSERAGRASGDSANQNEGKPGDSDAIGIVDNRDYVTKDAPGKPGDILVVLDNNGKPVRSTFGAPQFNNGAFVTIDLNARKNVGSEGAPITFELFEEGNYGSQNKDDWKKATILIKQGDTVLGTLKNYYNYNGVEASRDREAIFNALKQGKTVTATARVSKAKIANAVKQDGSPAFTSVTDVIEDPVLGFVMLPEKSMEVVAGPGSNNIRLAESFIDTTPENFALGQVLVATENPLGGTKSIALSTRGIKETPGALERAMELATNSEKQNIDLFRELVGTNRLEQEHYIADNDTFLNINANNSLVFYSPSTDSFVRIYPEQLVELGKDSNLSIETLKATEEGFESAGKKQLKGDTLLTELKNVINKKKLQVDFNKANSKTSRFTNPMTGQEEQNYREYLFDQTNPVLNINMHPDVGAYTNVGLKFSDINIEGQSSQDTNTGNTAPTPPPAAPPGNTQTAAKEGGKQKGPAKKKGKFKRKGGKGTQAKKTTTQQTSEVERVDEINFDDAVGNIYAIIVPMDVLPDEMQEQYGGLDIGDLFTIAWDGDKFGVYEVEESFKVDSGLLVDENGEIQIYAQGRSEGLKKVSNPYLSDLSLSALKGLLKLSDATEVTQKTTKTKAPGSQLDMFEQQGINCK